MMSLLADVHPLADRTLLCLPRAWSALPRMPVSEPLNDRLHTVPESLPAMSQSMLCVTPLLRTKTWAELGRIAAVAVFHHFQK